MSALDRATALIVARRDLNWKEGSLHNPGGGGTVLMEPTPAPQPQDEAGALARYVQF